MSGEKKSEDKYTPYQRRREKKSAFSGPTSLHGEKSYLGGGKRSFIPKCTIYGLKRAQTERLSRHRDKKHTGKPARFNLGRNSERKQGTVTSIADPEAVKLNRRERKLY